MACELISNAVRGRRKAFSADGPGLLGRLRRFSIRTQLLLVLVALAAATWLIVTTAIILHARKATRIEIDAAMELAEALLRDAIPFMQQAQSPENALASIPAQVGFLRHVRISVARAAGAAPAPPQGSVTQGSVTQDSVTQDSVEQRSVAPHRADTRPLAPAWFAALIAPAPDRRDLPVFAEERRLGSLVLTSAPGDEIAEVWENATTFAQLALVTGIAGLALLHFLFSRVLAPLKLLAAGLLDLGQSDYKVRLQVPEAEELALIAERFNVLAATLEAMRTENRTLSTRLISAQDDERRQTALDLHDEVAPYLFGLKATATSIVNSANGASVALRAREMLAMIAGLQAVNRRILTRLRPMSLGQIPLRDLLAALVEERARMHDNMPIGFCAEGLHASYGESIDLTLYHCLQESLTNIVRHAHARQARVTLMHRKGGGDGSRDAARVTLIVADDGCGISPGIAKGLGVSGMRERVRALGGDCRLQGAAGHGTTVTIDVPVPDDIDARATARIAHP